MKQATSAIPIVFPVAGDPVGGGFVATLTRPGGNVTGLSLQQTDVASKRVELLRDAVPGLRRMAILLNVGNANAVLWPSAQSLGELLAPGARADVLFHLEPDAYAPAGGRLAIVDARNSTHR